MVKGLLIAIIILLGILAVLAGIVVWIISSAGSNQPVFLPQTLETPGETNTTVTIHQSAINDMLAAIFPIEGEGQLGNKPLSLPYRWRLEKPHVELDESGPVISVDADIRVLGKSYPVQAQGRAVIRYDSTDQDLYMDVHDIQAQTNMKVLGIPLAGLHLAPSVIHVRLLRNLPLFTHFKVKKPQEVREEVRFSVAGYRVRYEKQKAIADLNLKFRESSQKTQIVDSSGHSQGK